MVGSFRISSLTSSCVNLTHSSRSNCNQLLIVCNPFTFLCPRRLFFIAAMITTFPNMNTPPSGAKQSASPHQVNYNLAAVRCSWLSQKTRSAANSPIKK